MTTDLDTSDLAVLVALRDDGPATPTEVRTAVREDLSTETVEERLSNLVEGGLVAEADGNGYELTPSGRRLLRTESGDEASRPDVPAAVERAIEEVDRRPDVEDALARAVAFLRNWGSATADEIIDAAYSETDAEYDDGEQWWSELVDPFGALPGIVPPSSEGGEWRYDEDELSSDDADETANVTNEGSDGRSVLNDDDRFGSAKHALEREAANDAEATAFAAAFEALVDAEGVTTAELAERAEAETGSSVDADRLADALESVPGARREGERWRYDRDERFWDDGESTEN
ncbi:hypothetical protein C474_15839 [Halogeometricum pallidum JCM 14848]|uniref:Uncharacterized protein n=1 Tax=Halogeometricum pallidum JCM 14848 TaxID=1227487 RepID=M0CZZ7_HALPD|nr:winged helix-turn-helix domain-containing protein [Halogeometricum pallidum]ELZ27987.1 hypothetical protein C474_15839 [Halogeometricum pallidum JCM 14848]